MTYGTLINKSQPCPVSSAASVLTFNKAPIFVAANRVKYVGLLWNGVINMLFVLV